jgi:predicted acylesterase/phospholipase RssA
MSAAAPDQIATVVMSGGAPHSSLMAGFLYALLKAGKMFKTFHTSGAGALMALLTIAPRDADPETALLRWSQVGVADMIYRWLPVNFKLFSKPGPYAPLFRRWAQYYKLPDRPTDPDTLPVRRRRLHNDAVDLWFSALTPSTLSYQSKGLAAPLPFLEELVDFEKFKQKADKVENKQLDFRLLVNAYCISDRQMEIFGNDKIDAVHVRAALSMPFIYPPGKIGDKYYLEGAAQDPLNFYGLRTTMGVEHSQTPPTVVVLDIMGRHPEWAIRVPRDLWDAYVTSVVIPIVALAKKDLALFKARHNVEERRVGERNDEPRRQLFRLEEIDFRIPDDQISRILDWSYSNLRYLFDKGIAAGEEFLGRPNVRDRLPDRRESGI